MNQASRNQGWIICGGAGAAALLFVLGVLNGSYWALALPVAVVTLFALGLVAWVGYTIATIQVEADASPEILATDRTTSSSSSPASSDSGGSASGSTSPSTSTSNSPSTSTEDAA